MRVVDANAGETVCALDRGLHYGDGCFETMRVRDASVPLLDWHAARLARTIQHLAIRSADTAEIIDLALQHIRQYPDSDWMKLVLTRGTGLRGYRPQADLQPTLILSSGILEPTITTSGEMSLSLSNSEIARLPALAATKHLNRLTEVIAARDMRTDECLLCDSLGGIVCGMMHNVFVVRDGTVSTPTIAQSGVAGVMRDWLLAHHPVRIGRITIEDLTQASEILLTNGVRGIRNATSFCRHPLPAETPVGSGLRRLLNAAGFPQ